MSAYYNENDPRAAAWLRELIRGGHIAPGEVDERDIRDACADDLRGFRQHHFFAGIDGLAGRVGLLRGYGNAIAAPVAQAFIEAAMSYLERVE